MLPAGKLLQPSVSAIAVSIGKLYQKESIALPQLPAVWASPLFAMVNVLEPVMLDGEFTRNVGATRFITCASDCMA